MQFVFEHICMHAYLRHVFEKGHAHFNPTQPVEERQQRELLVIDQNQEKGDTGRCDGEAYG